MGKIRLKCKIEFAFEAKPEWYDHLDADGIVQLETTQLQDLDNLMTILEGVDYSLQIKLDNDQT